MGGRKRSSKAAATSKKRRERRFDRQHPFTVLPDDNPEDNQQADVIKQGDEGAEVQERVWIPGMTLGEDEDLEPDYSAYRLLEHVDVEWPCLSFDLGSGCNDTSIVIITGTQAAPGSQNGLLSLKLSGLKQRHVEEEGEDSDESEDDFAVHTGVSLPLSASLNRIRYSLQNDLSAFYLEDGSVGVACDGQHLISTVKTGCEGYALAWSRDSLVTGDTQGQIRLWDAASLKPLMSFAGVGCSVEDFAWSPAEAFVFASVSSGGHVGVWDVRMPKAAIWQRLAQCDLNVLAWNAHVRHVIVTGADDGGIGTWDLRVLYKSTAAASFFSPDEPLFAFSWNRSPITSIAWNPQDSSVFAAACADSTVCQWDLAVERDSEQERIDGIDSIPEELAALPQQLLFVHHQRDPKELHWIPSIPGALACTGSDGFSIFRTVSI